MHFFEFELVAINYILSFYCSLKYDETKYETLPISLKAIYPSSVLRGDTRKEV